MSRKNLNRWYCAILYREDPNFNTYFKNINEFYEQVTYIIHDRDINEDGTPKKEHMHILFNVGENARYIQSVAKEIGIPENYIQGCNKKNMLMYMIHLKNPEKTQYNVEEVKGYLKDQLKRIMRNYNEDNEEVLKNMIEEIKKGNILTITRMVEYSIENGIYEEIKRNQLILCKLIEENKQYYINVK